MDSQIAHLHCNYRIIGRPETAAAIQRRLDRLVREQVPLALSQALAEALPNDPAVYVLRQVRSNFGLNLADGLTDSKVARQWGHRLAGAIMRRIAFATDQDQELIKFKDQADYLAHFVTDLLDDRAWKQWFYQPLTAYRAKTKAETLTKLLLDHRDQLPDMLGYLRAYGTLEKFLTSVEMATLRSIWSEGLGAGTTSTPETIRPLLAPVLALVGRLGLWQAAPPQPESFLLSYLSHGPSPVDWRDYGGLADAVADMIRFLRQHGYLQPPPGDNGQTLADRIDRVLEDFDWLDTSRLRPALLSLFADGGQLQPDLPTRQPQQGATPRQQALLADLAAVLQAGQLNLDHNQPDSAANALRLYSALIAQAPQWMDDNLASRLIRDLLAAWGALQQSRSKAEAMRALRQGSLAAALETLPEPAQARAADPLKVMAQLGESALDLVAQLSRPESPVPHLAGEQKKQRPRHNRPAVSFDTRCAGLFLLLRAVLDARLPGLLNETNYPPAGELASLQAMLPALGLRWAGSAALETGQIDPGLGPLSGLSAPPSLERLQTIWAATPERDHQAFQAQFLSLLAGQRLVKGDVLNVYQIVLPTGQPALIGGDETGLIWPLGQLLEDESQIGPIIAAWLATWAEATGSQPTLVLAEALAAMLPPALPEVEDVVRISAQPAPAGPETEPALAHQTAGKNLPAALAALEMGCLGRPVADLTLALTALALLRLWARWLQSFAQASPAYLLENFIRRAGRVTMDERRLLVEMDSRPLDIVIELAGYTAGLERVAWLEGRTVEFQIREG